MPPTGTELASLTKVGKPRNALAPSNHKKSQSGAVGQSAKASGLEHAQTETKSRDPSAATLSPPSASTCTCTMLHGKPARG